MNYLEAVTTGTPDFFSRVQQTGYESRPVVYTPLVLESLADTDKVLASLRRFTDFYSGPVATEIAKGFTGNAKSIPPGEFVLTSPYKNFSDYLIERLSTPVYSFTNPFSLSGEGRFHMDGRLGIGIGYKADGEIKPYSLGFLSFVAATELALYDRLTHAGDREAPFSADDLAEYTESDLVIFQLQGQSLSRIRDERRRTMTKNIQDSVAWRQLIVTLITDHWANEVGCGRMCILSSELGKWEGKLRRARENAVDPDERILADDRYDSFVRQYDGVAQKLGYIKNQQGLWELPRE